MEFKVNAVKQKRRTDPHYKVSFSFMEGDADGSQDDSTTFKVGEEDVMKEFVMALERCNAGYPRGKGGDDSYYGLPEYDAFFAEEHDFDNFEEVLDAAGFTEDSDEDAMYACIKEHLAKYNTVGLSFDHPYDTNYMVTSFNGYGVVFVNENGDKQPVSVSFTAKEKAYIKAASEILN